MEENGSDIDLALHLLSDPWRDPVEPAVVISNHTDLVVPIRMVTRELKRPVLVVCPGRWRIALQFRNVATHVRHIRAAILRAAQFLDTPPGTAISKPAGWHWKGVHGKAHFRREDSLLGQRGQRPKLAEHWMFRWIEAFPTVCRENGPSGRRSIVVRPNGLSSSSVFQVTPMRTGSLGVFNC